MAVPLDCRVGSMFDRGLHLTLQARRRQIAAMPYDLNVIRLTLRTKPLVTSGIPCVKTEAPFRSVRTMRCVL
jgi:hypothetical protein